MEISNFDGLSLSKSFEEMSLPNILDIFNKFKASAMDDDNCEILQSGIRRALSEITVNSFSRN